jgi:hypothetical protein
MSNVFVTTEDSFDLSAYYTKEGKFEVFKPGQITEEDKEKFTPITLSFVMPDYAKSRAIMRQSTVHFQGQASIDFGMLQNALFEVLVTGWNLKDEKGEEIPFSFEKLGQMRPDIARCFVEQLAEKLVEEGVYDSILLA